MPKSYLLEPYGLVAKVGTWYVVGRTEKGLRTFRMSRVREVALLNTTFSRPSNFDLRRYWHTWTQEYEQNLPQYEVTLNVHPGAIKQLGYHTSARLDEPNDSTSWRELSVTFENPEHALGVLVTIAAQVEVVAPTRVATKVVCGSESDTRAS